MMGYENIVVVNGFFDPIHDGHIDLFSDALKYGRLQVLVNSNEMAIDKKDFYFMDEKVRLKIINSIRYVSLATIIQDEDHWEQHMRELMPNYFLCSGDRRSIRDVDNRVKRVCDDIGCAIVFGKDKKINSSSDVLSDYADHVLGY